MTYQFQPIGSLKDGSAYPAESHTEINFLKKFRRVGINNIWRIATM
jgi:hypothetical protein